MSSHPGTPYRIAPDPSAPTSASGALEELLRGRLRIAGALAAFAAGGLGLATLVSNLPRVRDNAMAIVTEPPFAGPMLLMAMAMVVVWHRLRPAPGWTLTRLRVVEWSLTGAWAAFFVVIITRDLRNLLAEVAHVPIDLAMAHSSMWGLMLVALGVLIPTTPRHGARRTAALFLCTWIPALIVALSGDPHPANFGVYLGTMGVMTLFYAALSMYGGYHIETLRRDAQAARQLGQYVLTTPLGSGGMGEVYLAEHRLLRRPCAVKLIRPEQAGDQATLRRFEREAQATAALTHPNTIQIYDYGIADDGTFYYVMEYLSGVTLEVLLEREGAQQPARVVSILTQLCGALQEAHARGLVHRDIKPGNVILGERGGVPDVAKLLDFGLVATIPHGASTAAVGDGPESGLLVGTPAYMSPEQCGGDDTIGPASDIYSLGAVAFALLTGESPFAGRPSVQMLVAHLHQVPRRVDEIRPGVPAALADVVAQCLEKAPERRYADARSLEAALLASL
jgi:tRNA A-37 threonylcarbamoyl transferase component Bud32